MADIHIHRSHGLGLAKARKTAWKWAETVEEKFGMECTVIEGRDSDVVEFTRAGVDGRLLVTAGRAPVGPSARCADAQLVRTGDRAHLVATQPVPLPAGGSGTVVVALVDQIHGLRHHLRRLGEAVAEEHPEVRARIAARIAVR